MLRSSTARWAVIAVAVIAILGVLRFKPWHYFIKDSATSGMAREQLKVGFLPVT